MKPGLAPAFHSGDPAFDELPGYFWQRFGPALASLLEGATANGEIRDGISPKDLLYAIASLCVPMGDEGIEYCQRMVGLLIDGLFYGADASRSQKTLDTE